MTKVIWNVGGNVHAVMDVPLGAPTFQAALEACARALDKSDVPAEGRLGFFPLDIAPFNKFGIAWSYSSKLPGHLVVAWHEDAFVPPAFVLQPAGIVYCRITREAEASEHAA